MVSMNHKQSPDRASSLAFIPFEMEKPLKGFLERTSLMRFVFLKNTLALFVQIILNTIVVYTGINSAIISRTPCQPRKSPVWSSAFQVGSPAPMPPFTSAHLLTLQFSWLVQKQLVSFSYKLASNHETTKTFNLISLSSPFHTLTPLEKNQVLILIIRSFYGLEEKKNTHLNSPLNTLLS